MSSLMAMKIPSKIDNGFPVQSDKSQRGELGDYIIHSIICQHNHA